MIKQTKLTQSQTPYCLSDILENPVVKSLFLPVNTILEALDPGWPVPSWNEQK